MKSNRVTPVGPTTSFVSISFNNWHYLNLNFQPIRSNDGTIVYCIILQVQMLE